jgi:RHS repeat-associated protein
VKRYFAYGVQQSAQALFYTRDHLGSIRELSDNAAALKARYDYDPYGKRSAISEEQVADFGFAGHYQHSVSDTALAQFRVYDSRLARWISGDPSGYADGPNLYHYARNNPLRYRDKSGEASISVHVDYHPYNLVEDIYGACGPYFGCFHPEMDLECKCTKKGCWWYPAISGDFNFDVYFHRDPRAGAFDHEYNRHVASFLGFIDTLTQNAENFEAIPFPSEKVCTAACKAWVLGVELQFFEWSIWNILNDADLLLNLQ